MREMGFMEKLLDGAHVEWKSLASICKIETGKLNANAATEDGAYMFFTTAKEVSKIDKYRWDTEALLIAGNANVGDVKHYSGKFEAYQRTYVLTNFSEKLNVRYLFHIVSNSLKQYLEDRTNSAAMTYIVLSTLENFPIPIPCPDNPKKSLEIQAEIVRILDAMTAHTAELTAELTARKKQYDYYRDKLLSFEEIKVNCLPMGHESVGEFIRGGGLQKKDFTETGVGCIHYGQIYTHYGTFAKKTKSFVSVDFFKKARKAKSGDLVIATTSENDEDVCKAVAWLGTEEIAVSSDACIYRHKLNPKFVSYFFKTEHFQKQKRQFITGTKVRRVNADDLAKILIPTPSPEEQARIVAILDKFDALTSSLTEGLPREIELRQKQYAYYRDLLLSFPAAQAA